MNTEQHLKEQLDQAMREREDFLLTLCMILELSYEDVDITDVLKKVRLAVKGVQLAKTINSWLDRHVNLSANSYAKNEIERFVREWDEKPS